MTERSHDVNRLMARIDKLLELSSSPNEAEAAAAAAKVRELLVKYNLEIEDVRGKSAKPNARIVLEKIVPPKNGRRQQWEVALQGAIANAYFCRAIHSQLKFYFIGEEADVEVAAFTFSQLQARLETMAAEATHKHGIWYQEMYGVSSRWATGDHHPKAWRTNWLRGAVEGIRAKLWEERRKDTDQVTALVRVKNQAIEPYVQQLHPHLVGYEMSGTGGAGYRDGYNTGRSMDINPGLSGSPMKQLGG